MEMATGYQEVSQLDKYRREAIAIGNQALMHAYEEEDLYGVRHFNSGSVSVVTARSLFNLSETATDIYAETDDTLTVRGVARFMVHQNELLETYTPLEFCAVGQEELAIEAAKCFYDPEYENDIDQEYFYPRLVRTIDTLKRIYSV